MLPGLIHRLLTGLALILLLAAALVWPARHVLIPLWPQPIDERIVVQADGGVHRQFVRSAVDMPADRELVARDRPLNLLHVETDDAVQFFAYLVGVREDNGGALVRELPAWLARSRPEPIPDSGQVLVFLLADEDVREVPVTQLRRLYRPNQLGLHERALMAWQSLGQAIVGQHPGAREDQSETVSPEPAEMR